MNKSAWKIAAALGLAAVIIVLAVALIVTRHDPSPSDELPEVVAPERVRAGRDAARGGP